MIDYPHEWDDRQKLQLSKTLFYIHNNAEYEFTEFVEAELLRLDRVNRKETNFVILHQRQGACQVLDNLLKMLKESDKVFNALKK